MSMRALRIGTVLIVAWTLLYVRFHAGMFPQTEIDPYVHFALLPIALLIGLANGAMEASGSGTVQRRDSMWGLVSALVTFGILHWAKVL